MLKTKVAINGVGRIGRAFIRTLFKRGDMDVVAVNDLADIENITYLLKYDSVYGQQFKSVSYSLDKKNLIVDGKIIRYFSEKEISKIPWGEVGVDVVVESTGAFATFAKSREHLNAGAKKVVFTAPSKDEPANSDEGTILMGVNCDLLEKMKVTSNASCTTNAGSPIIEILKNSIGIEKAILNTVHGYTSSQNLVDGPNKKDWKEGRAGAFNMVPTTTGAAIATTKVIPDLENKFDGISIRVPIISGSIADITFIAKKQTTVEEVNSILEKSSKDKHWSNIFSVTREPLVSSDIVGSQFAGIVDLSLTKVVDGNLVKVMVWYDNEMGYAHILAEHVYKTAKYINK